MKLKRVIAVEKCELASLRFEGPANRARGHRVRAIIVRTSGEDCVIFEGSVDPTEPRSSRPFLRSLVKLYPGIDIVDAKRRFKEFTESREVKFVAAQSPINIPYVEPELTVIPQNEETVISPASPAEVMLRDPNLFALIIKDVQELGVAGEEDLIGFLYLLAVSRLLPKPLAAIISSASSSGKSHTLEQVSKCIPPEAKVVLTTLTTAGLFHLCDADPDALKHKFVVLGERKKQRGAAEADATAALRQLISEHRISRVMADTSKKPSSKREMVVEGPIAFVQTTTSRANEIFAEDLNRCMMLKADDSPAQTERVLTFTAAKAARLISVDEDAIVNKHHDLQRLLKQIEVVITFAKELIKAFPLHRPEVRRAFNSFISVIEASALLHQKQRELSPDGRLVARLADYDIARRLCGRPLEEQLGRRISVSAIKFFGLLLEWPKLQAANGSMKWNTEFTVSEALELNAKCDTAVRNWLKELATVGAVEETRPGKGRQPALWRLTGMTAAEVESRGISLPDVEELKVQLALATTEVQVIASM